MLDMEKDGLPLAGLDAVVSSMAFHHVKDVRGLLKKIYGALAPGGIIGIADLDSEDGGFHRDAAKAGVRHRGFDRAALELDLKYAGFRDIKIVTAYKSVRENGEYPVFLACAKKY